MVPFKGRSFLHWYMPNKPHKWGSKIFSCKESSSQVYDFDFDFAPDARNSKISKKLGYCDVDIALKLTGHIPNNRSYKLYFDKPFTCIQLLIELKSKNIWAVGTLSSDHMRGCTLKSEKDLKKDGRGSYDCAVEKNSLIRIV